MADLSIRSLSAADDVSADNLVQVMKAVEDAETTIKHQVS
jgi:hypothetical protein